uniref:Uncharacterized protein n=1 Tax=Eutreptiella gymnastica TaxID=73025 RepID=A0A7S4LGC4_9EUGL
MQGEGGGVCPVAAGAQSSSIHGGSVQEDVLACTHCTHPGHCPNSHKKPSDEAAENEEPEEHVPLSQAMPAGPAVNPTKKAIGKADQHRRLAAISINVRM